MSIPLAPFNTALSLYAGLTVHVLKLLNSALSAVTADEATDKITKNAHGLLDKQGVIFVSGTGFTGLTAGTLYYARDITANDFKLAATPGGVAIDITVAGTVGVFQPVHIFESIKMDQQLDQQTFAFRRPDVKGVSRIVREITNQEDETYVIVCDEAKRLLSLFGGALAGRVDCTVTSYMRDPNDAAGKCALKSETDWAGTLTRNSGETFGDGKGTLPALKLRSNKQGAITWTADADVS